MAKSKGGSGKNQGRKPDWEEEAESRIKVPFKLAQAEQKKALTQIWSILKHAGLDLSDLASALKQSGLELTELIAALKNSEIDLILPSNNCYSKSKPRLYRIYSTAVAASFEVISLDDATAGGYEECDLTDLLIKAPERTIFLRVIGNSMVDEGIYPGSILSVETPDRSWSKSWLRIESGNIVVALIDNADITVKRFRRTDQGEFLEPRNRNSKTHKPILLRDSNCEDIGVREVEILGIVRSVTQFFK
ncbi:MAG: hypothetical protein KME13_02510 [Myxacorys californica WJT36-NPBG1]|jgi:SOS-response transcriptional repressor LexA|nr:hypothetical protein [Myxacorys californica WJT36-NPBG1]